jgi:SAM-dependent methyltransferase
MIDISYNEEFDAVINMVYSFGFFETDEENNTVLQKFYKALKPGGKFLFHTDVNIPRILSVQYKEDEIRHLHSQKTLRIIDKYNPEDKRIHGAWLIQDQLGKTIRKDYSVRVYTLEEFIDMCTQAGFTSTEAYS